MPGPRFIQSIDRAEISVFPLSSARGADIVASRRNGTLYVGSTDDLIRRMEEHRHHAFGGFTAKYGCMMLVWHEVYESRDEAFKRERRIKEWRRSWKLMLIEAENSDWRDLFVGLNFNA